MPYSRGYKKRGYTHTHTHTHTHTYIYVIVCHWFCVTHTHVSPTPHNCRLQLRDRTHLPAPRGPRTPGQDLEPAGPTHHQEQKGERRHNAFAKSTSVKVVRDFVICLFIFNEPGDTGSKNRIGFRRTVLRHRTLGTRHSGSRHRPPPPSSALFPEAPVL